jgi:hypothetical protein
LEGILIETKLFSDRSDSFRRSALAENSFGKIPRQGIHRDKEDDGND